jgi:RNA polymerase sigma-70 factor (ECF subfamily)
MPGEPCRDQPSVSSDDATVIARVLDGDRQQFAHLVERYQASLYRHAMCLVLDHDVAADMVQEAFVRAYTQLHTCRNPTRFRAWVFQMLRNRCFDYLKDVRRKHVSLDKAGDIGDLADGPDGQMERRWLRDAIGQALQQLPDPQREAFLMHYVEHVPYDEMAVVLEASVSALKMRVWRARDALIAVLRAQDVTPDAALSSCSQVGTRRWIGTWVPEEEG